MDALYTGSRISELRRGKNLTQQDLAERLHVTNKAVSKWERGKNFPDLALLPTLAAALDTTVSELLGVEQELSEDTIIVMSAISQQEKRSIKTTLYRFLLLAMFTGALFLFLHFAAEASLMSAGTLETMNRVLLALNAVLLCHGGVVLEKLRKKFAAPEDFVWPADQNDLLLRNVKIQLALWRERLRK